MCFFFKHFQQVCRANIEKVLSIRGSVFIPFNEGSVIAFRVVLESVIELDSMSLAGPFQPRAFCDPVIPNTFWGVNSCCMFSHSKPGHLLALDEDILDEPIPGKSVLAASVKS